MRSFKFMGMLALATTSVACDIPTEPPILEQRWVLPLNVVTLGQEQLLPPSVAIAGDSYDVDVAPVSFSETLGALCGPCAAQNGLTVPTPPYSGSFVSTDDLPADVEAAVVVSGSVDVTITNNMGFDPLFGGGTVTITVGSAGGGPPLGTLTLDGTTETLPDGSVTLRTLTLGGGTVTGALETSVTVNHMGGQVTTIDTGATVSVSTVTTSLLIGEATVAIDGLTASLTEESLGVEDISDDIIESIQHGSVLLDVTNPFGVSFDGTLIVGGVMKTVSITGAASSTVEIPFTGGELQSILQALDPVDLREWGPRWGAGRRITRHRDLDRPEHRPHPPPRELTMRTHTRVATTLAIATLLSATDRADAQLAQASATTVGMAGNTTAFVRGFGAISVNPAGLGMPGSGFSLALAPVQARAGLAPIKLGDLALYQNELVPTDVRMEWLDRVTASGGENGVVGADVTPFALDDRKLRPTALDHGRRRRQPSAGRRGGHALRQRRPHG